MIPGEDFFFFFFLVLCPVEDQKEVRTGGRDAVKVCVCVLLGGIEVG